MNNPASASDLLMPSSGYKARGKYFSRLLNAGTSQNSSSAFGQESHHRCVVHDTPALPTQSLACVDGHQTCWERLMHDSDW